MSGEDPRNRPQPVAPAEGERDLVDAEETIADASPARLVHPAPTRTADEDDDDAPTINTSPEVARGVRDLVMQQRRAQGDEPAAKPAAPPRPPPPRAPANAAAPPRPSAGTPAAVRPRAPSHAPIGAAPRPPSSPPRAAPVMPTIGNVPVPKVPQPAPRVPAVDPNMRLGEGETQTLNLEGGRLAFDMLPAPTAPRAFALPDSAKAGSEPPARGGQSFESTQYLVAGDPRGVVPRTGENPSAAKLAADASGSIAAAKAATNANANASGGFAAASGAFVAAETSSPANPAPDVTTATVPEKPAYPRPPIALFVIVAVVMLAIVIGGVLFALRR